MIVKFTYGPSDNPTWEVFGNIRSYKVERVAWKDYEDVGLHRKIKAEKCEQSSGTLVRLRFDDERNTQLSILTAHDVYACADNGDTIEKF